MPDHKKEAHKSCGFRSQNEFEYCDVAPSVCTLLHADTTLQECTKSGKLPFPVSSADAKDICADERFTAGAKV